MYKLHVDLWAWAAPLFISSTLSLYSPKVPRLTLRCRVYLALPAEQAAEGKQAQQQLAALVHGADKPTHLVRVRVGVGVGWGWG